MKLILKNTELVFAEYHLSEFTKNAIIASGNDGMTLEQKAALETFFSNLGAVDNTGIWAKIDKIYLPLIAVATNKSMVNYKNNNVDALPSSDWIVNKGLKYNGSDTNDVIISNDTIGVDSLNLSMFVFSTEIYAGDGSMKFITCKTDSNDGNDKTFYSNASKRAIGFAEGRGIRINKFQAGTTGKGFHGFSSGSNDCFTIWNSMSPVSVLTERGQLNLTDVDTPYQKHICIPSFAGATSSMPKVAMLLVGKYLTESECATIQTNITTLTGIFGG